MKPIFLSFSPFGCVAAGKLFAAVCSRFERYFWYKLIQVAMVSKVFRHLVHVGPLIFRDRGKWTEFAESAPLKRTTGFQKILLLL